MEKLRAGGGEEDNAGTSDEGRHKMSVGGSERRAASYNPVTLWRPELNYDGDSKSGHRPPPWQSVQSQEALT